MKSNFINTDEYPEADRQYKDRLFRFVFQKPEDLLSLYNAVNGTDYKDPSALEINTLGNVLYLSMKNDISFLISGTLNLYEHQSTCNPNMPMRGLFYFSRLYEKYIAGQVDGVALSYGAKPSFPTILTQKAATLHIHSHDGILQDGNLVLNDCGAESFRYYCSDYSRSWPVSGKYTQQQREIYDIAYKSYTTALAMAKPGIHHSTRTGMRPSLLFRR